MKRKKRFTIRMVALGLAVAGLAAPSAQAWVDEGGVGGTRIVSPDDRPLAHGASYSSYAQPHLVVSPDDRAVSRMSPAPEQPTLVSNDDGFEIGTLQLTGIILLLGAGAAVLVVAQSRRSKLASTA